MKSWFSFEMAHGPAAEMCRRPRQERMEHVHRKYAILSCGLHSTLEGLTTPQLQSSTMLHSHRQCVGVNPRICYLKYKSSLLHKGGAGSETSWAFPLASSASPSTSTQWWHSQTELNNESWHFLLSFFLYIVPPLASLSLLQNHPGVSTRDSHTDSASVYLIYFSEQHSPWHCPVCGGSMNSPRWDAESPLFHSH